VATKSLFAKRTPALGRSILWRQSCISQNELDAIRRAVTASHHFAKRTLRLGAGPVAAKSHFANEPGEPVWHLWQQSRISQMDWASPGPVAAMNHFATPVARHAFPSASKTRSGVIGMVVLGDQAASGT
jgi:hypothetical protein